MAWKLTIATVDVTTQIAINEGVGVQLGPMNSRSTARFTCVPGLVPTRMAEVVIYALDGVTPVFGGVILSRRQKGTFDDSSTQALTDVECGDFSTYTEYVYTTVTYASPVTLKTVLQALVTNHLAAYGISLDAAQVTGPTLTAFAWAGVRVADALRELTDRTGYVLEVSPLKVLKMSTPGSTSAPFTLTDGAPHCNTVTWQDPATPPANQITAVCGPSSGSFLYTAQKTSNGVQTYWEFDVFASVAPGTVKIGSTYVDVVAAGSGGRFEWDNALRRLWVGTDPVPANGVIIELQYTVDYPFEVTVNTGGSPVIEIRSTVPTALAVAPAKEAALGILGQLAQSSRTLVFTSADSGWKPGQALTVALTGRITASCVITGVRIDLESGEQGIYRWLHTVDALESTTYAGDYLDRWRQFFNGGLGSAGSGVSTGGGVSTSAPPSPAFLGGSRNTAKALSPAAWTPVPDHVPFVAQASYNARIRVVCWAKSGSVSVATRLYNETTAAAAFTAAAVTSTSPTEVTAAGPVIAGHRYRLEMLSGTSGEGVFAIGSLESV